MEKLKLQLTQFSGFIGFTLFFIAYLFIGRYSYLSNSDSEALVSSSKLVLDCLENSGLSYCKGVVHFPLFQFIPSVLLIKIGVNHQNILKVFVAMNLVALFTVLMCGTWTLYKKNPSTSVFFPIAVMASPSLWYGINTFNEMTAAALTLCYVTSCLSHSAASIIVFAFLAGITKETSFPFLLIFGAIAAWESWKGDSKTLKKVGLSIILGVMLSMVANAIFNRFRFNIPYNWFLLQDYLQVNELRQWLSFFFGLLLGPNGGILVFWPVAFLVMTLLCFEVFFGGSNKNRFQAAGILLGVLGLTAGFAKWFAPFGWVSWGARLHVPWMPTVIFLSFFVFTENVTRAINWITKSYFRIIALFGFIFVFALPQIAVLRNPGAIGWFFSTNEYFDKPGRIDLDRQYYFDSMNFGIWSFKRKILHEATRVIPISTECKILVFGFGLFLLSVLLNARFRHKISLMELHKID
jgi:hypothetical protein